ncbi:sodium/potassium-transporting ATPase subunit beta-like [Babylonia areolata]|uniref:sodium/potassium-transporting ATPase subunit beta-like n=1 Tax=Babylonia areolata TaxID=304850 RepID=UPI003FD53070
MSAKSTWMSGGSGSGVYDPVTTADNVVQYTDQDEGWLRFKGRKYNFGTYRNTGLKGLCDNVRNRTRPKCLFIGFIATVLLLLLIAIIVIASHRDSNPSPSFKKWVNTTTGLNFRPVGQQGTVFLPFSVQEGKNDSYLDYIKQLDAALEPYKTVHIHNGPNVVCNSTYKPVDKVCQQPLTVFGTNCVPTHKYGYSAGQPCILLTLNLPANYSVRALRPNDGQIYVKAEKILGERFSPEAVGISCEPATPEDKQYIGNTSALGDAIDYNPGTGFPLYFFRPRTVDSFLPPAVMVQFRTIRDSLLHPHMVRLQCTAWGKAMDPQGNVVNDNGVFTTTFIFRIH